MQNYLQKINNRLLYLSGALFVVGLIAFGFYLQYIKHQDPCPLCMVQRLIFIGILALFVLAAIQNPKRTGQRIYAALISLVALSGIAVASRHIWLQNLPKDQVPACGPGLEYLLSTFPLNDVLQELMHGSGECAAKGWTFLSLGIPEWSLISFVNLAALAVVIAIKK